MNKRKSLVTAISISKEIDTQLRYQQLRLRKSRSELFRDMIGSYFSSPKKASETYDPDPNKVLRNYYQLISKTPVKPTMVIGIAIISENGQTVIGKRRDRDPVIKDLTWTWPSGKFESLDFDKQIVATVKQETGLSVKPLGIVHARLIPDSPAKKIRVVALYFHCKLLAGHLKSGGDFAQTKWVPALEVNKYFTTSVCDEIMNFLGTL